MQNAAEHHLDLVWKAHNEMEETGAELDSPAVGPFDGCDVCVIRETLAGAWPLIEAFAMAVRDGKYTPLGELIDSVPATDVAKEAAPA